MEQKDISKIENYVENFGVDKLDQLCKGLEIRPYELVINFGEIAVKDLLKKKFFTKGVIIMLYQYYLLLSRICDTEISDQEFDVYGIGVKNQSVPCIKNVSTNQSFVQSLVNLCNANQVSPDHLMDVIEDALFENERL